MKKTKKCPKCGSIDIKIAPTKGDLLYASAVKKEISKGFFGNREKENSYYDYVTHHAYICIGCGYTELYLASKLLNNGYILVDTDDNNLPNP